MKRNFKIVGLTLAVTAVLVAVVAVAAGASGDRKARRVVDVAVAPVAFARDAASVPRGKYLFESRGCGDCHGADGKGRTFIDSPNGLYVKSPNITSGPGGVVKTYTERDWVRSIRHGVNPQGLPLLIMPSQDYNRLTDQDLAAVVAYTRSLPPVAGEGAVIRLPLIVKALYAFGAVRDAAETIDHSLPPSTPVPVRATVQHGAYVANMCVGCHGIALSGGKIPGAPPEWPAAANLTPGAGTAMTSCDSAEKFTAMMRTGKRPDGSEVSKVMPFTSLRMLDDTDLEAVHVYLKALPPRATGNR